jgi:F-type H+-transporting ATPase subunit delta
MILKPKQYAQALFEALRGKNQEQMEAVIDNFAQLLIRNRDVSKADKIIQIFNDIWNREQGIIEAEIVTSAKTDEDVLESIKEYIAKATRANEVEVRKRVDKNILGGFIVRYEDKVIDASLRTQVRQLKSKLVK